MFTIFCILVSLIGAIMKEQETIDKFLQLRAEGKSFDKIVKLLNVSKPTLIKWGNNYLGEIAKLKEIRYEQILEKYKLTQEDRLIRLAKELNPKYALEKH